MVAALGVPTPRALLFPGRKRYSVRGRMVALALPCLLVWAVAASAADAPEPSAAQLGVLAPVQVEAQVNVPKDGLWRSPHSTFVCADTVRVVPEKGQPLQACEGEPQRGQFQCRPDGSIKFAAADAGRRLVVRYQFRPRRAAVLDAATPTDYPDVVPLLGKALTEELGKRGFVVVSAKEIADAAAAVALGAASPRSIPPPEKLVALAQRVNAAYVVVPGVAVTHHSTPGSVDLGIPVPEKKPERHPRSPIEEEQTLSLPISQDRLYGAVRITVVDGASGSVIADEATSGYQRVRLYRFSHARRSLVLDLAAQAVAAWREPSP
jgi:hypothetical protein